MEGILFQPPKKKTEQMQSKYLKWMQGEIELYYSKNVFEPINIPVKNQDFMRKKNSYMSPTKPKMSEVKKSNNLLGMPDMPKKHFGSSERNIYNKKHHDDISEILEAEET